MTTELEVVKNLAAILKKARADVKSDNPEKKKAAERMVTRITHALKAIIADEGVK
ncbi:MAG: hypothetical protein KKE12_17730 [Proteobacteria bacterium]|nr:hypothetical protein [Pseudomonadota bacterium]